MRTTITLDDKLLAKAEEYSGITNRRELIHEALRCLIQRQAARELAAIGGTMPDLEMPPRRRSEPA